MLENVTRADLRQRIGKALNEITVETVYAGTKNQAQIMGLVDSLESPDYYVGAWAWMLDTIYPVSAYGERRIAAYDPDGGLLTFSRDWSESRGNGLPIEIHRMIRPSDLNDLINEALRRITFVQTVTVEPDEAAPLPTNLLANGDMEAGVAGWTVLGDGTFAAVAGGANGTATGALLTGTGASIAPAVYQDAFTAVVGQSYTVSFWLKDPGCGAWFSLGTTSSSTAYEFEELSNSNVWTYYSYTFTASSSDVRVMFTVYPVGYTLGDYIYIDEVSLTQDADADAEEETQTEFNLTTRCIDEGATLAWLTDPRQIAEVYYSSGAEMYRSLRQIPFQTYMVTNDDGDTEIWLKLAPYTLEDDDCFIMEAWRHPALYTDDGSAMLLHVDWEMPLCLALTYEYLTRHGPAQDAERYQKAMQIEMHKFYEMSKLYAPRPRLRVQMPGDVLRSDGTLSSLIVRWE
jgi:hypothetical protein